MSEKTLKTKIALRRDLLANYQADYVLLKGEICFVELPSGEVKSKLGDGVKTFAELPYSDSYIQSKIESIVVRGYYYDGQFYVNKQHTERYVGYSYKLYVENDTRKIYSYNGSAYELLSDVPYADGNTAGISKLYDELGNNEDGSVTQKCITGNLNKKVEMELEEEMLILTNAI